MRTIQLGATIAVGLALVGCGGEAETATDQGSRYENRNSGCGYEHGYCYPDQFDHPWANASPAQRQAVCNEWSEFQRSGESPEPIELLQTTLLNSALTTGDTDGANFINSYEMRGPMKNFMRIVCDEPNYGA